MIYLESIGRQTDVLLQVLFKITNRLPHIDLVVHILAIILDLNIHLLSNLEINIGQTVEFAMLRLELEIPTGFLLHIHKVPQILSLAVLLVIGRDVTAVETMNGLVEMSDENKVLLLVGETLEQRYILDSHMPKSRELAEMIDRRPVVDLELVCYEHVQVTKHSRYIALDIARQTVDVVLAYD